MIERDPASVHGGAGRSTAHAPSAIEKALTLLDAFDSVDAVGVSELARRAGLSKSTAYRILGTLHRNGMVERSGDGYRLGRRLHDLGRRVYENQPGLLREVLLPHLTRLYELTHETIHLAILHDTDVVCLEKLYGYRATQGPSRIGASLPPHSTAVGKMLLSLNPEAADRVLAAGLVRRTRRTLTDPDRLRAELSVIRRTGIAYDYEESAVGLACVSVPLIDGLGNAVAAISVSGARARFEPRSAEGLLRSVASAATRVVRRRGALGGPGSAHT
jgi:DNA-binding IclR family transcriptional regulator